LIDNNGYANIPAVTPYLWWDWESPFAANVTATNFQFNVKGLIFDNRTGELDSGVLPPEGMPAKNDSNPAKLQGFVSTYGLNSVFSSGLSVFSNYTSFWVNSSDVSDEQPFPTNTSNVEKLLPGIVDYYGPNVPVNVRINMKEIKNITVSESNQKAGGKFTIQLEFWVITRGQGPEQAAAITLKDTDFDFTVLI